MQQVPAQSPRREPLLPLTRNVHCVFFQMQRILEHLLKEACLSFQNVSGFKERGTL